MDEAEVFQEQITLDLTGCADVGEFWDRIRDSFGFPGYFGRNWDAFSDLLEGDHPARRVRVLGANTLPGDWKTLRGIHFGEMLRRVLEENKKFKERFDHAFDWEFIDA